MGSGSTNEVQSRGSDERGFIQDRLRQTRRRRRTARTTSRRGGRRMEMRAGTSGHEMTPLTGRRGRNRVQPQREMRRRAKVAAAKEAAAGVGAVGRSGGGRTGGVVGATVVAVGVVRLGRRGRMAHKVCQRARGAVRSARCYHCGRFLPSCRARSVAGTWGWSIPALRRTTMGMEGAVSRVEQHSHLFVRVSVAVDLSLTTVPIGITSATCFVLARSWCRLALCLRREDSRLTCVCEFWRAGAWRHRWRRWSEWGLLHGSHGLLQGMTHALCVRCVRVDWWSARDGFGGPRSGGDGRRGGEGG